MGETAIERHASLLESFTSELFHYVSAEFQNRPWSKFYVDIRATKEPGCLSIQRVLVDGERIGFSSPNDAKVILLELLELRHALPGGPWYGCLVVITSEGECHVEYDYDENCISRLVDDARANKPF